MQQFRVGDLPAFGWLISFVDNGSLGLHDGNHRDENDDMMHADMEVTNLVGMFECPTIHAIVRHVQPSLGEPGDVALFKSTRSHSMKGPVPMERLAGGLV